MTALKTGIHPNAIPVIAKPLTTSERVELWFVEPLKRMKDDDGFVALMICLPLLEKMYPSDERALALRARAVV